MESKRLDHPLPYPWMKRAHLLPMMVISLLALPGCVATALVGGAAIGSAAFDARTVEQHAKDVGLAARIKARLIAEKDLPARWVGVQAVNDEVLLTGNLVNEEQLRRAVYIAKTTPGVKNVRSEIRIGKPKLRQILSDTWITTKIKSKLLDDPVTSGFSIHVETVGGTVYLNGVVKSIEEKYRAQEIALSTPGVVTVKNLLRIKGR